MDSRALKWLLATATGVLFCWLAMAAPLWLIGSPTTGLEEAAFIITFFVLAAHWMHRYWPRWFTPASARQSAILGFFVLTALSALALHVMGERISSITNLADMTLSGLLFGVPGGIACRGGLLITFHILASPVRSMHTDFGPIDPGV